MSSDPKTHAHKVGKQGVFFTGEEPMEFPTFLLQVSLIASVFLFDKDDHETQTSLETVFDL